MLSKKPQPALFKMAVFAAFGTAFSSYNFKSHPEQSLWPKRRRAGKQEDPNRGSKIFRIEHSTVGQVGWEGLLVRDCWRIFKNLDVGY